MFYYKFKINSLKTPTSFIDCLKVKATIRSIMENIIEQNMLQIQKLMQRYGVLKAYAFGSAVKNTMTAESDVDFIISFPTDMHYENYANNYFGLANALEDLLKKRVELVAEETLSNPYLVKSIDSHKIQVL